MVRLPVSNARARASRCQRPHRMARILPWCSRWTTGPSLLRDSTRETASHRATLAPVDNCGDVDKVWGRSWGGCGKRITARCACVRSSLFGTNSKSPGTDQVGRCDATVQFERGGEPQAATANASKWIRKGMNSPRRRFRSDREPRSPSSVDPESGSSKVYFG